MSNLGRKYRIALKTKNNQEAGKILTPIVMNLEFMKMIQNILERKKLLTNDEIGKELAYKYSKDWSTASMKMYGGAVGSILGFCGIGVYSRGVLRKSAKYLINKEKPIFPSTGFNKIFKITRKIYNNKETNLDELEKDFGKTISNDLGPCIELGLIKRVAPKVYIITKKGSELANIFNEDKIQDNWRRILLESKYGEYIMELQGRKITIPILGEFLNNKLGGNWKSKETANTYAKKFNTWLNEADFLEKMGQGKYLVKKMGEGLERSELKPESLENEISNNIISNNDLNEKKTKTVGREIFNKISNEKIITDKAESFSKKFKKIFKLIVFLASQLKTIDISFDEISKIITQDKDLSHTKIAFELLKNDIKNKTVEQDKLHILLDGLIQDLNLME